MNKEQAIQELVREMYNTDVVSEKYLNEFVAAAIRAALVTLHDTLRGVIAEVHSRFEYGGVKAADVLKPRLDNTAMAFVSRFDTLSEPYRGVTDFVDALRTAHEGIHDELNANDIGDTQERLVAFNLSSTLDVLADLIQGASAASVSILWTGTVNEVVAMRLRRIRYTIRLYEAQLKALRREAPEMNIGTGLSDEYSSE